MELKDLIRGRRLRLRLTEQDLAERIGCSRASIYLWEKGETAPKRARQEKVAAALGLTVGQLMSGEDPDAPATNVSDAAVGTTRVPLISNVQAGNLTAIMDDHAPGAAVEYLLTDLPVSRYTFALEIKGDSMLPEFKEGDRVVIDPEVKPQPGDYVAAKTVDAHGHGEATFKKYRPRGVAERGQEVFELAPLNQDYPSLRSDTTPLQIIGTMVEHRRYRRPR